MCLFFLHFYRNVNVLKYFKRAGCGAALSQQYFNSIVISWNFPLLDHSLTGTGVRRPREKDFFSFPKTANCVCLPQWTVERWEIYWTSASGQQKQQVGSPPGFLRQGPPHKSGWITAAAEVRHKMVLFSVVWACEILRDLGQDQRWGGIMLA